jgi:ParB family chromosome partitioning protein
MATTKPKGLGRGLDALLGGASAQAELAGVTPQDLPVSELSPGRFQPRKHMDLSALDELAQSIRTQGVIQPIIVRPLGENRYEILAGERRWRAAQKAGLSRVPVVVRDVPDNTAMAFGLIENIQREDLNAIEEATGVRRLLDEFKLTHEQVAMALGRSRVAITNLLRLLDLAPTVRAQLAEGKLEMGHARALLGLSPTLQIEAAAQVIARGLSVRATEALVRAQQAQTPRGKRRVAATDPDTLRLQNELADSLGAQVELRARAGGKGELVLRYSSLAQLDGLVERLRARAP